MRKIIGILMVILLLMPQITYAKSYGKGKQMTVLSSEGKVSVTRGVEENIITYKGMRLEKNDIIETTKDAKLSINIDDKQVTILDEETTIKISKAWWGKIRIDLIEGSIVNKVVKNSGVQSETHTPNTTFGVRGTTYSVRVEEGNTTGITYEGEVSVKTLGSSNTFIMKKDEIYENGKVTPLEVEQLNAFEKEVYLETKEKDQEKDKEVVGQVTFSGGNGTKETPYLISRVEQLLLIETSKENLNKHYKQIQNLTIDENYIPIGTQQAFEGTYDGNGYNIVFVTGETPQIGVFNQVGNSAQIQNVNVESELYQVGEKAGGIASINQGKIENCQVNFSSVYTSRHTHQIGGIVAVNEGHIKDSEVRISSLLVGKEVSYVGGIAAINDGLIEGTMNMSTIILSVSNSFTNAFQIAYTGSTGVEKKCIEMGQIIYQ